MTLMELKYQLWCILREAGYAPPSPELLNTYQGAILERAICGYWIPKYSKDKLRSILLFWNLTRKGLIKLWINPDPNGDCRLYIPWSAINKMYDL